MPFPSGAEADHRLLVRAAAAPVETALIVHRQRLAAPAQQIDMTAERASEIFRQGEQPAQRVVPGGQLPTAVEHADALRQIVERRLQHDIAFGQFAGAGAGILRLRLGNVGIDADDAAFAGAQFVDLYPAAIGQPLHLATIGDAVLGQAIRHPAIGRDLCPGRPLAVRGNAGDVVEGQILVQPLGDLRPEAEIGFIIEDQPVFGIEQHETFVDRFDRIAQAHLRGVGIGMRLGQIGIGLGEAAQRILQLERPVAHLGFKRDGSFEHGEGVGRHVGRAFHPVHQRAVDLAQLAHLLAQGIQLRVGFKGGAQLAHRPIANPLKVWLTCNA